MAPRALPVRLSRVPLLYAYLSRETNGEWAYCLTDWHTAWIAT